MHDDAFATQPSHTPLQDFRIKSLSAEAWHPDSAAHASWSIAGLLGFIKQCAARNGILLIANRGFYPGTVMDASEPNLPKSDKLFANEPPSSIMGTQAFSERLLVEKGGSLRKVQWRVSGRQGLVASALA